MTLEQLFDLKPEGEDEFIKMTPDEFITKTKALLKLIDKAYATSWTTRWLEENEYEIAPCGKCTGNSCFIKDGKEIQCVQDRSEGDCFERFLDHEQFTASIENIMFIDPESDFYSLIQARVEGFKSNSPH